MKIRNKLLIIFFVLIIIIISLISWNFPYFLWSFWYKWKIENYNSLYLPLTKKNIEYQNSIPNWKKIDFGKITLSLPVNIQLTQKFKTGIEASNNEFKVNVFALKPDSIKQQEKNKFLYNNCNIILRQTPDDISFFQGYSNTKIIISQLLLKSVFIDDLVEVYAFDTGKIKGLVRLKKNWSEIMIYSMNKKYYAIMLFKGKSPKKNIEKIISTISFNKLKEPHNL